MEMKQLKNDHAHTSEKDLVSQYAVLSGKILLRILKEQRSGSSRKLGQKRIMLAGGAKKGCCIILLFEKKDDKQE